MQRKNKLRSPGRFYTTVSSLRINHVFNSVMLNGNKGQCLDSFIYREAAFTSSAGKWHFAKKWDLFSIMFESIEAEPSGPSSSCQPFGFCCLGRSQMSCVNIHNLTKKKNPTTTKKKLCIIQSKNYEGYAHPDDQLRWNEIFFPFFHQTGPLLRLFTWVCVCVFRE